MANHSKQDQQYLINSIEDYRTVDKDLKKALKELQSNFEAFEALKGEQS